MRAARRIFVAIFATGLLVGSHANSAPQVKDLAASDSNIAWSKQEVADLVLEDLRGRPLPISMFWRTHVKAQVGGSVPGSEKSAVVVERITQWLLLFRANPKLKIQMGIGDGSENILFYFTEDIFALSNDSQSHDGVVHRHIERTLGGPRPTQVVKEYAKQTGLPCYGAVGVLRITDAENAVTIHRSLQLIWIVENTADLVEIDRCVLLGIGRAVALIGKVHSETPSIFNPNFMPATATQQDLWLIRQMIENRWFNATPEGVRRKIYADPLLN